MKSKKSNKKYPKHKQPHKQGILNFPKNISPILTTKQKLKLALLTNIAFQIISLNILIRSSLTFSKQQSTSH
jgi:hypothetical protein